MSDGIAFSIAHCNRHCTMENASSHYANMHMLYTAIFHGCKNDNFQMKNCDSFLIFDQYIDCGYTLEPSR